MDAVMAASTRITNIKALKPTRFFLFLQDNVQIVHFVHVICLLQNPHRTEKGILYVGIEPEFFAVVFFGSQLPIINLDWQALPWHREKNE